MEQDKGTKKLKEITEKMILDNMLSSVFRMHGHEIEWVNHGTGEIMQTDVSLEELQEVAASVLTMSNMFFQMAVETIAGSVDDDKKRDLLRANTTMIIINDLGKSLNNDPQFTALRDSFMTKIAQDEDLGKTH